MTTPLCHAASLPGHQAASHLWSPGQTSPRLLAPRREHMSFTCWTLERFLLHQICFSGAPTHGPERGCHTAAACPSSPSSSGVSTEGPHPQAAQSPSPSEDTLHGPVSSRHQDQPVWHFPEDTF